MGIGEDVGEMAKKAIHAAETPLVEGTEAAMETAEKVVEKAGRGLVNTGLAATEGVIGEIPGVGGVLDLVLAAGKGFNAATSTFRGAVDNSEKFVDLANKVVGDNLDMANETVDKIQDTKNQTTGIYNRVVDSIDDASKTVKDFKNYEDTDVEKVKVKQTGGKKRRRTKRKKSSKKRKSKTQRRRRRKRR